jgi:DNA-binding beta-propeller fold protein YncE
MTNAGPVGLAFDRAGNLFVSTGANPGSGTIFKFTPNGTESTFAMGLNNPRGLAFNRGGNLFVAEIIQTGPGDILRFTPSGIGTVFDSGIGTGGNGGPEYLAVQPPPQH